MTIHVPIRAVHITLIYTILLCSLSLSYAQHENASGTVYFVSTEGSDDSDGTSPETPFRTLAKALEEVAPGDTIQLRGGVYFEYVDSSGIDTVSGEEGLLITIESFPGERAIFDGSEKDYRDNDSIAYPTLFKLEDEGVDWYRIRNLTFRNSAGRALQLEGDHHIVQDIVSYNNASDGVYVSGSHNLIEGVLSFDNFSRENGGESADGIKVPAGDDVTIRNCHVYNNSDDGVDVWAATNVLIEGCISHDNGRGEEGNGAGFKLGNDQGVEDTGNTIQRSIGYRNRAQNFYTNGGGGISLLNNTSFSGGEYGFWISSGDTDKSPHIAKNNLSFGDPDNRLSGDEHYEHNSWDLVGGDPEFASLEPDSPEFLTLTARSPAIDAGTPVGLPFEGDAPDLGALEFGSRVSDILDALPSLPES